MNHDTDPLPLDLYALGRGLAYGATLLLIGVCVFAALIPRWRGETDDDQSLAARSLAAAWRLAAFAPWILLLAHLLRAYGQVLSFLEPGEPFTWDAARPVLLLTTWGRGWLAQMVAAVVSAPLALLGSRRPPIGLSLLATAALAVAATSPLTGHAVQNPWGSALGVGLHTIHLLGAGVWLGTLACIVVAGLGAARRDHPDTHAAVARMVNAFSPVALIGAGLAVTAGSLMALAYVGDLTSLWGTTYGRVLLVKVTLLLLAAGLGAYNWRRVRPRLGTPAATIMLQRSATVELLFALGLVAVTALLVALPAPKV